MAKTSKIIKTQRANEKGPMVRRKNRCKLCGRPRGFIRYFGVCRLCFRELAAKGELPGVTRGSF